MITTQPLDTFIAVKKRNDLTENQLLAALSPKEFRELIPDMERVSLSHANSLQTRRHNPLRLFSARQPRFPAFGG